MPKSYWKNDNPDSVTGQYFMYPGVTKTIGTNWADLQIGRAKANRARILRGEPI